MIQVWWGYLEAPFRCFWEDVWTRGAGGWECQNLLWADGAWVLGMFRMLGMLENNLRTKGVWVWRILTGLEGCGQMILGKP